MEFSSRMKDYYDIYYLASKFDFEGKILTEALQKTFSNRGHIFTQNQFEEILGFGQNSAMNTKWKAFVKKSAVEVNDFSFILSKIKDFLAEPFAAAVKSADFNKHWISSEGIWK
jgi:hypothetical protein